MPDGFSLRRYAPDGRAHQYPEPGGWVLAMHDYDYEWMTDYLNHLTPYRRQSVHFCPWCGENSRALRNRPVRLSRSGRFSCRLP